MSGPPSHQFQRCPRCGGVRAEGGARVPFVCAHCGFTLFFNPAIAAVAFVRDRAGRLLLIRRSRDPGRGKLAPPGGFVDIGERVEDALRRECREEVHVELEPASIQFVCSEPNVYTYKDVDYPVIDLFFTATAPEGSQARAGEDVDHVLWLEPTLVKPSDLAFVSMQRAFRRFLEGLPAASAEEGCIQGMREQA